MRLRATTSSLTLLFAAGSALSASLLPPSPAAAAVTFYSDPAAFAAAQPSAAAEDYSGLSQGLHANNLSLPGLTVSTVSPGTQGTALIVYGNRLGNNWFGDTLVLSFDPSVTALGAQILAQTDQPGSSPVVAPITEDVFSGSASIFTKTISESTGFFGVASTTPITKVTFFADCDVDCSTNLTSLSIASAASGAGSTPVPEPDSAVVLAAGLAACGPLPKLADLAARRRGRCPRRV